MTKPGLLAERSHWTAPGGQTATLLDRGGVLPPKRPRVTEVVLVRHGETDWNRDGRCQGLTDTSLNADGIAQAEALRPLVAAAGFTAAFTSPLARARETAGLLLGRAPLDVIPAADLREIDYGHVTGLAPGEWRTIDPALADRWSHAPWTVAFPGGESFDAAASRAERAWNAIVAAHRRERILIVGHGHLNRLLVLHGIRADVRMFWSVPQPNAAVWRIELGD